MRGHTAAARWTGWLLGVGALWLSCGCALAQAGDEFRVPGDPNAQPPRWVLEVHMDGIVAADNDALCPQEVRCVYEGGGGVGASAELRWPRGLGLFAIYDAWFIDSAAVFELGVQQGLGLGVRYTLPNAAFIHPVFDLSVGASFYGDTFLLASSGVLISGKAGLQFELSRYFGVLGAFGVRAFTHSPFTTERDGVRRGQGEPFSQALFFQIALTIDGRPWAAAEP